VARETAAVVKIVAEPVVPEATKTIEALRARYAHLLAGKGARACRAIDDVLSSHPA
jgi:hypothetical protein